MRSLLLAAIGMLLAPACSSSSGTNSTGSPGAAGAAGGTPSDAGAAGQAGISSTGTGGSAGTNSADGTASNGGRSGVSGAAGIAGSGGDSGSSGVGIGGMAGVAGNTGTSGAGTSGASGSSGGDAGSTAGTSAGTGGAGAGGAASGASGTGGAGGTSGATGSGGAAGSTAGTGGSGASGGGGQTTQRGCATPTPGCYTVYAHSADTLYYLEQATKSLVTVGGFRAPLPIAPIVDLAVTPDDVIWVISATALYTANATDGHVTKVGAIGSCGQGNAALTADRAGHLYAGDFTGAVCTLDLTTSPPTVGSPVTLGAGYALVGDLAVIGNGTMFGTVYMPSAAPPAPNFLATIDATSGAVTAHATSTGFLKLFGVAYAGGKVFAFSHDGSGDAIAIDPATGAGTLYATLSDPTTHVAVAFQGAGVNPLVSP